MADRQNGMWRFATRPGAGARGLGLLVLACIALGGAGLLVPTEAVPYFGATPFAPALAGAAAAGIAIALAWPLRFLLRRRPGYYGENGDTAS